MKNINIVFHFSLLFPLFFISCKKDWLDAKPNKSLVVPSKIEDYQALLDNYDLFNVDQPELGELASDNYYLTFPKWQTLQSIEQKVYVWDEDPYQGQSNLDWQYAYVRILNSNVILEGINKINQLPSLSEAWNNVKGSALFYRALDYYNLAQIFCKQFNANNANNDLGLPLRLSSDANIKSVRSTLKQTYDQIISDLILAKDLLPTTALYKTRPSKPAIFSLLARIYLSIREYSQAKIYADSALQLNNNLIDYNLLSASTIFPIPTFNTEVIFHSLLLSYAAISFTGAIVDSTLFNSFDSNDLRKTIFFRNFSGALRFWGSYQGKVTRLFSGLATDEMYLIRAECNVREGNIIAGMSDLNTLLINRWKSGTFVPFTANNANDALARILIERTKELCFRGIRWSDLRRLNVEGANISLTRNLNGKIYALPPNDPKYVFLIPPDEIRLSGIQQNPR